MTSRSPKSEAVAYRIWCYAEPRGWDVSVNEIAEALNESPQRVGAICQRRGWLGRMRVSIWERNIDNGRTRSRLIVTPSRITPDLRREIGV